jgi:ABC-2 type transport system permease protein
MLSNTGDKADGFKYITFFSLFNPNGIINGDALSVVGIFVMLAIGVSLFVGSVMVFNKKDLYI